MGIPYFLSDKGQKTTTAGGTGPSFTIPQDSTLLVAQASFACAGRASIYVFSPGDSSFAIELKDSGSGESVNLTWSGALPVAKGTVVSLYQQGVTANLEITFRLFLVEGFTSSPNGGSDHWEGPINWEQLEPTLETITTTAGGAGAINADLKPGVSNANFLVRHPIQVRQVTGGAANVDIVFTDGSSSITIESKVALANNTWSVVDFATAFPELTWPIVLGASWYVRATVTAGAGGDTISIRAANQVVYRLG